VHAKRINACVTSVRSGLKVKANFNNTKKGIKNQRVPILEIPKSLTYRSWTTSRLKLPWETLPAAKGKLAVDSFRATNQIS